MATVYPFRALRPRPDLADQVASVPYDVVNRAEARALADGNQKSFLHVTKPEIDLSDEVGLYDDAVYAQAKTSLDRLVAEGTLVRDDKACFYAYELVMDGRAQTGVVLAASVPEYDDNIVRKHEYTRPDKENDRVRNVETLQAQSGTVFLIHKDHTEIARVIKEAKDKQPAYGFTTPDGIAHRFWVIDDAADIKTIEDGFTSLGPIYIADGHHRSAAASRVAAANRKGEVDPTNTYEKFLAVSFPQNELKILPYNRVVKDLLGKTPAEFLAAVKEVFDVSEGKPATTQTHQYAMYLDKKWYALTARDGSFDANDPVERLDVSILQNQLLAPLLDIKDPRRDKRVDFVGGIRGDGELEKRVNEGWAVAFSLHATSIDDLFDIADAEQVMPPKSTWFEPKLRDGMAVYVY